MARPPFAFARGSAPAAALVSAARQRWRRGALFAVTGLLMRPVDVARHRLFRHFAWHFKARDCPRRSTYDRHRSTILWLLRIAADGAGELRIADFARRCPRAPPAVRLTISPTHFDGHAACIEAAPAGYGETAQKRGSIIFAALLAARDAGSHD